MQKVFQIQDYGEHPYDKDPNNQDSIFRKLIQADYAVLDLMHIGETVPGIRWKWVRGGEITEHEVTRIK